MKFFVAAIAVVLTAASAGNTANDAMDDVLAMLLGAADDGTVVARSNMPVPPRQQCEEDSPAQTYAWWGTPLLRNVPISLSDDSGQLQRRAAPLAAALWAEMQGEHVYSAHQLVYSAHHNDSYGAGGKPYLAGRGHGQVAVLVCRAAGFGDINGNIVSFSDPRPQAGVLPLPPWFGVHVPETWEAQPGFAVVFPAHIRYYLPVNLDPDVAREFELLVFSFGQIITLPEPPIRPPVALRGLTWHWSTLVQRRALGLPEHVRLALAQLIESIAHSEPSQVKSNRGGWQSQADFLARGAQHAPIAELRKALQAAVFDFLVHSPTPAEFDFLRHRTSLQLDIHTSWAARSTEHNYNTPHSHPGATISGVYYVQVDTVRGGLLHFLDPRSGPSNQEFSLRPENDHLVLFPAWLDHYVEPCSGPQARLIVSFNVNVNVVR